MSVLNQRVACPFTADRISAKKGELDKASLQVFLRTAETLSFREAGRKLGLSASGAGKNLGRLEERLGVRLFHRNTRNVSLTAQGEVFLERAAGILREMEAAEQELAQSIAAPRGQLRIGLPLIGAPFLSRLSDFRLAYPDITLDLDFDNRLVDPIADPHDAVIRSGELADSRLTARPLGAFGYTLAATSEYLATRGRPKSVEDLLEHDCIHLRNRETGRRVDWPIAGGGRGLPATVVCNTSEAQLHFVTAGAGLSWFPDFVVKDLIAAGRLAEVLPGQTEGCGQFSLLWPSGRHVPAKLRAFIDFMTQAARDASVPPAPGAS